MVQNLIPISTQITNQKVTKNHSCPNCGHQELSIFYEVRNVPVHSCLMMSSQEEALNFPCGDVVLGFCDRCGFITNTEFDSKWSAYAPNYEDQQSFSPTFNKFAYKLASNLVDKYDLHRKDIIEIGCSKGDFLLLICELGNNRGIGIDPSVVPGRVKSDAAERVRFIQDYYSEKHAKYVGDLICCRHTLEHIQPTAKFIQTVRNSIGDRTNTAVVFEIPDNTRVLQKLAFEDIYYEHCSYFSPGTLARLFRSSGFEVTDLYRDYGDQYLLIEAMPINTRTAQAPLRVGVEHGRETRPFPPTEFDSGDASLPSSKIHPLEETLSQVAEDVKYFAQNISQKLQYWKEYLEEARARQEKVVVWGSGSKCVAFLTTLNTIDRIEYAIDINPHRHGKFIPGVGKEIMPPEFLKTYQPDKVIVMNAIYRDEINTMLKDMGVVTEVVAL